jgi:hypothetical protein
MIALNLSEEATMTMSATITEIANRRPHDAWLKIKLSELEAEIEDISADRNRLIIKLSRARNQIHRLMAGIQEDEDSGEQQS